MAIIPRVVLSCGLVAACLVAGQLAQAEGLSDGRYDLAVHESADGRVQLFVLDRSGGAILSGVWTGGPQIPIQRLTPLRNGAISPAPVALAANDTLLLVLDDAQKKVLG